MFWPLLAGVGRSALAKPGTLSEAGVSSSSIVKQISICFCHKYMCARDRNKLSSVSIMVVLLHTIGVHIKPNDLVRNSTTASAI